MIDSAIRLRRSRRRAVLAGSWLWAMAAAMGSGCGNDGPPPANDVVRFELDFGNGVTLSSVDYIMTGPAGFRRIGTLAVGDQPSIAATFQNLPVGNGYDITVKGTASDDSNTCKGEVMFNVAASMTATIQIPLICTGQAAVAAVVNVCPVIDSLAAIPSEVYVGNAIVITSVVHDADNGPSPLSATWQTNGGALSNLSTTGATFTCTAPGSFTVGLRISDGDTMNRCPDTAMITLVCTPVPSAQLLRSTSASPAAKRPV
jgi:hypothetical protein